MMTGNELEEVVQLQRETRSSIELKRNAKGEYGWDLKVYFEDTNAAGGEALTRVKAIDAQLREHFIPHLLP